MYLKHNLQEVEVTLEHLPAHYTESAFNKIQPHNYRYSSQIETVTTKWLQGRLVGHFCDHMVVFC